MTSKAIKALMDPVLSSLSADIVIGRNSNHKQVETLAKERKLTTVHEPMSSLAGLAARADLAIGAGGTSTWERACLRLPSIVITTAENQQLGAQALNQAGIIDLLGDAHTVSPEMIQML